MKTAYLDSSSLLAIAFSEPEHELVARSVEECDRIFSSNLMEAEIRAAVQREGVEVSVEELIEGYEWVLPSRSLSREFRRVLDTGYLRGADLWHVACALLLADRLSPYPVHFISLDRRQIEVVGRMDGLEPVDPTAL